MIKTWLSDYFNRRWYQQGAEHWLWRPLSLIYEKIVLRKRRQYLLRKQNPNQADKLLPPVLVVGNLTVGGTGKTPLVIFLVESLRAHGLKVAVLSRGYGGRSESYPLQLSEAVDPQVCGDEPYMIFQRTGVALVVDPLRLRGLHALAQLGEFDLVISDDGLQHYALPRQFEVVVVDAMRGLGNGACLPAGPLREPKERLQAVDAMVVNGNMANPGLRAELKRYGAAPLYEMQLVPQQFLDLHGKPRGLDSFQQQDRLQAIAGIGNPQRFFNSLGDLGIRCKSQAFPDHHAYRFADLEPFLNAADFVLVTEKDAVKIKPVLPPQYRSKVLYLVMQTRLNVGLIHDIMTVFTRPTLSSVSPHTGNNE